MNFSRKNAPNLMRLGCVFGNACFDITKAIGDDLLEFPRVVFTIEEVLQVKDGLSSLDDRSRWPSWNGRQAAYKASCFPNRTSRCARPLRIHKSSSELDSITKITLKR